MTQPPPPPHNQGPDQFPPPAGGWGPAAETGVSWTAPRHSGDYTTAPQPPVVPGPAQPYSLGQLMPTPPPPRRPSGLRPAVVIGIIAAFTVLGLASIAVASAFKADRPASTTAGAAPESTCAGYAVDASTGEVVCKGAGAADVVNQAPTYATPTPADFTVTVKILRKKCFGSAGCNIRYRIDPEYTGAGLDPAATWLVTYEVHGVEDGPAVNTFEVTGDQASFDSEESAQTVSSKSKLTVKVTDVSRG